jgi:hypothetical protein
MKAPLFFLAAVTALGILAVLSTIEVGERVFVAIITALTPPSG